MNDLNSHPRPVAEIVHEPSSLDQFLDRNQKNLVIAAIALLFIGAGIIVYKNIQNDTEATAAAALIAAYDTTTNKYDPAKLEAVSKDFKGTNATTTAIYLHTLSLWDAGKTTESINELNTFISNNPKGQLRDQAAIVLASRHLQQDNKDKAIQIYQMVVDSDNPVYSPVALLCLGDIARAQGELDKAKAYYQEVQAKYPDSSFAYSIIKNKELANSQEIPPSPIQDRLDLLEVKAPKVVQPSVEVPKFDTSIAPAPEKK